MDRVCWDNMLLTKRKIWATPSPEGMRTQDGSRFSKGTNHRTLFKIILNMCYLSSNKIKDQHNPHSLPACFKNSTSDFWTLTISPLKDWVMPKPKYELLKKKQTQSSLDTCFWPATVLPGHRRHIQASENTGICLHNMILHLIIIFFFFACFDEKQNC